MARGGKTMGFLALLLFGSIVSSGARSLARTHYQNDIIDAALGRQLLGAKGQREKEDNGPEAQVPAACRSSSGTKNDKWTTAGCGDGCQSCKTQPSSSGSRECVCCMPGYVPSTESSATCTACPVGTFARLAGSTKCLPCTRGQSTRSKAATACSGEHDNVLLLCSD